MHTLECPRARCIGTGLMLHACNVGGHVCAPSVWNGPVSAYPSKIEVTSQYGKGLLRMSDAQFDRVFYIALVSAVVVLVLSASVALLVDAALD